MDIYDLDVGRLCNVVYAALVEEAGPLADRSEVREHLDSTLRRASSAKVAKGSGAKRGRGMSPDQAKRIASDLTAYDSKIVAGRLRDAQ